MDTSQYSCGHVDASTCSKLSEQAHLFLGWVDLPYLHDVVDNGRADRNAVAVDVTAVEERGDIGNGNPVALVVGKLGFFFTVYEYVGKLARGTP